MPTQKEKYHLSIAGEFYVAAQLQRYEVHAVVTYGNAKKADVVVFSSESKRYLEIEVKSTGENKWVIGGRVPEKSEKPWVLVFFPEETLDPPEFYILTQAEMNGILTLEQNDYFEKYKMKHGEDYGDRPGVTSIKKKDIVQFKNKWDTIFNQLKE